MDRDKPTIGEYYNQQTGFDDDALWTEVPFFFAWICWAIPWLFVIGIFMAIVQYTPAWQLSDTSAVVDTFLAAGFMSYLTTLLTRYGQEHWGWFGGTEEATVRDDASQLDYQEGSQDQPRPVQSTMQTSKANSGWEFKVTFKRKVK